MNFSSLEAPLREAGQNVFAIHMSDKGLIFRIDKELLWIIFKRQPNRKMAKEDIQMFSKYMKRYSASLVIRKMQIQIRMSYSYPRMRMAKMRKMEKENRYCVWGATGTLVHCRWKGRLVQPVGKLFGRICYSIMSQ